MFVVGLTSVFFLFKNGFKTVSETVNKPLLKRGESFIDPETGEELIVNKKGGRKKKVNPKPEIDTTSQ